MKLLQWFKYYIYKFVTSIFHRDKLLLFASSAQTKWFRDMFFRPKGIPEIYNKEIQYFQFTLIISCPLQILLKAETKGIESSLSRLIMNELSKGDQCIDVGANYGFITMIMAKIVGKNGHVFSFEADKKIYEVLIKNINNNDIKNTCTVMNNFITNKSKNSHEKLDNIFKEDNKGKIKLIKIDIDGSDYNCLLGAEKLIKMDMPIIVIEINESGLDIYNKLVDLGYSYFYDQHYKLVSNNKMPLNLIASNKQLINS